MGLDMYLSKRIFVGAEYDHRKVRGKIDITIDDKPLNIDFKKVSYITENIAYWRKANHIHTWFVNNVQNGKDECQESYVSTEKLKELYLACKKVLDARKVGKKKAKAAANEYLPPQEGFFFGGTDIDDYYYNVIEYTMDILFKAVVEAGESPDADFYYRASW